MVQWLAILYGSNSVYSDVYAAVSRFAGRRDLVDMVHCLGFEKCPIYVNILYSVGLFHKRLATLVGLGNALIDLVIILILGRPLCIQLQLLWINIILLY